MYPTKPQTITPEFECPVFYWPLGTSKVSDIGVRAKEFGKLNLYPEDHVEVLNKLIARHKISVHVNPLLFNMVPQIDLPISESREFESDSYGIMTCDLLQIALRAHVGNVCSCHTWLTGYCGQLGYLGNPFFGTFWIYNDADSMPHFSVHSEVETLYYSVKHKRNVSPLSSVNFFVGVEPCTGKPSIMLTRVYGSVAHYIAAAPKLIGELERLGFAVAHSAQQYTVELIEDPSLRTVKQFCTVPTYLQIRASDHLARSVSHYRYGDINKAKAIKVLVQDADLGFNATTLMVAESHSTYPLASAQALLKPIRKHSHECTAKFRGLANVDNVGVPCIAEAHFVDNPQAVGVTEACEFCRDDFGIDDLTLNAYDDCYYCDECLNAHFVNDRDDVYIPVEDCTEVDGMLLTPRILERDYCWSDFANEYLRCDDCVWSDYHDTYLPSDECTYCEDISDYVADENACYCEANRKHYLLDNCVYSNILEDYIPEDDATYCSILSNYVWTSDLEDAEPTIVELPYGTVVEFVIPDHIKDWPRWYGSTNGITWEQWLIQQVKMNLNNPEKQTPSLFDDLCINFDLLDPEQCSFYVSAEELADWHEVKDRELVYA